MDGLLCSFRKINFSVILLGWTGVLGLVTGTWESKRVVKPELNSGKKEMDQKNIWKENQLVNYLINRC